jgi:hypothetical protein
MKRHFSAGLALALALTGAIVAALFVIKPAFAASAFRKSAKLVCVGSEGAG